MQTEIDRIFLTYQLSSVLVENINVQSKTKYRLRSRHFNRTSLARSFDRKLAEIARAQKTTDLKNQQRLANCLKYKKY